MNPTEIFDRSVYNVLVFELGPDDAAEVLNGFLADTSGKLELLATRPLDRLTTRREAHSLKSSSATFGFFALSRLAEQMEASALEMSPVELQAAIEELRDSFSLVCRLAEAVLPVDFKEVAK